jgi:toxin CcdB
MAQFDYYPQRDAPDYWLDCQTEFMVSFDTRFVVPLLPFEFVPPPVRHLNAVFEIKGERHTMVTQYASAVPAAELRHKMGSLANRQDDIIRALDFLTSGI